MAVHESLLLALDELENLETRLLAWGVTEATLSREEVLAAMERANPSVSAEDLLGHVIEEDLLLRVGDGQFRTRTAETVRLAASLRQWFGRGEYGNVKPGDVDPNDPTRMLPALEELGNWEEAKRLISDFRFRAVPRLVPRRDRSREEVLEGLHGQNSDPALDALKALLPDTISRFQEDSLRAILGWRESKFDTAAIVTAGTGAGKTFAFYLPVLASVAANRPESACPQVLAIYPRNELLKDQMRVAFGLCRQLDATVRRSGRQQLSIGALFGDVPSDARKVSEGSVGKGGWKVSGHGHVCPFLSCPAEDCEGDLIWTKHDRANDIHRLKCVVCGRGTEDGQILLTRERLVKSPPDLLFISMEMLNRYLQRSGADRVIGGRKARPRYVLLDEVHTYGGVTGAQYAYVLRRWRSRVYAQDQPVAWVGLSATLQRPVDFFRQLIPISGRTEVLHLKPAARDLDSIGKQYSLILKGNPFTQAALLAVTIQALMLLERTCTMPRATSGKDWKCQVFGHKTFAFTDTLDVFSRLEGDLADAESKLLAWLRSSHPDEDGGAMDRRQRAGQLWGLAEAGGWHLGKSLDVRSLSSKWQDEIKGADVVVATSSLEVGFDDDEVNVVFQHKAPRDWASFLQRIGRAGRKISMRPWAVTVLSDYGRDGVAFQNYHEFFAPELRYRPVPVENAYVLRIQAAFAVLDLLAEYAGAKSLGWQLTRQLQGNGHVMARRVRDKILSRIDAWLEDPAGLRKQLEWRLRWPQAGLLDSALYQPPRSLLYEFLPAVARLARGEGTAAEASSAGALAYFLPSALFQPLDLPEVEIALGDSGEFSESMPVERFLGEYAPLKVSKRFSDKSHFAPGHWFAPDKLGERLKEATGQADPESGRVVLSLTLEEFGRFELEQRWGIGPEEVQVYRPVSVRLREQGDGFNERSNAFLDWKTRIEVPGEEALQAATLPQSTPLANWVSQLAFALHTHGTPVTMVRYAESARAILQHRRPLTQFGLVDGQEVTVKLDHRGSGRRVAIGFAQEVDGVALRVADEALSSLGVLEGGGIEGSQRTDFFRESFRDLWSGTVESSQGLNAFQLDRLSGLFLGELGAGAHLKSHSVEKRLERWRRRPERLAKDLRWASSLLYSRLEIDAKELAHTEVLTGLDSLIGSEALLQSLMDFAEILHADPEVAEWRPAFVRWQERRALSAIGATFLAAVRSLLPDMDLDSLQADQVIQEVEGERTATLWITESTPGGIGNVLQIRELYLAREEEFLWAWGEASRPGQTESLSSDLRAVLHRFVDETSELSGIARLYRESTSASEQESAVIQLREGLENMGTPPRHELMSPLFSRVLAAGTSPVVDRLMHSAGRLIDEADEHLPFECPVETVQLLLANDSDGELLEDLSQDHPWSHEWGRLRDDPKSEVAMGWKAQRLSGFLWPRDRARIQQELGTYNRFSSNQRMDLTLLRRRFHDVPSVEVASGRPLEEWWPEMSARVQESPAEVHLRVGAEDRVALAVALRWLATQPVDNDVTSGYLRVVAVRRDAEGWYASVQVQDLVQ